MFSKLFVGNVVYNNCWFVKLEYSVKMNVAAFYCGKNDKNNPTFRVLDKFLDGVRRGGAQVSFFNITNLDIKPCKECTVDAFYEHLEHCRCEDDMNSLYPIFRQSDMWIFSASLNLNGEASYLKNIMDRMEPLFQPVFLADSGTGDFPPELSATGKLAFIGSYTNEFDSVAGDIADLFESLSILFSKDYIGLALRLGNEVNEDYSSEILNYIENAGYELITGGRVSNDTYNFLKDKIFTKKQLLQKVLAN